MIIKNYKIKGNKNVTFKITDYVVLVKFRQLQFLINFLLKDLSNFFCEFNAKVGINQLRYFISVAPVNFFPNHSFLSISGI